jgi:hypothetical protein
VADNDEVTNNNDLEVAKLYQDTFKHMTTFCSGALAVAATTVAALFKNAEVITILSFSFICFLLGAAAATLDLYRTLQALAPEGLWVYLGLSVALAYVALAYVGVAAFGLFVLVNFSLCLTSPPTAVPRSSAADYRNPYCFSNFRELPFHDVG